MNDYYDILGVSKKAALSEIKKAYKKLARKYHPDLNPGDKTAEHKFKEITEAYEILRDPDKRRQYDTFGTIGNNHNHGRGNANFEGFDFTSAGSSSFGDIFETLFGNRQQTGRNRVRREERGEDLHYAMNLGFLDAANGLETPIQITRKETCTVCSGKGIEPKSAKITCPSCGGSGRIQKQTGFMKFAGTCSECDGRGYLPGKECKTCGSEGRVDRLTRIIARIPAGVGDNSRVRIPGKGHAGRFGGPPGDLIITINVSPHKFFKRNGANLEVVVPVTYQEAALGGKIEVPTLEGQSMLKVPPETSSGQKLRLKSKGIIDPKSKKKGDMIIEIKIVPPPTKDIEVRQLLKAIEEKAPYHPRENLLS